MSQFSIAAYITSIATFSIAILVFFYNKKSVTNRIFCLYSLSISEWSFFTASHALAKSEMLSLLLARMMNIGVPLIPIFFFHFCLALLEYRKKYKKRLLIGYTLATFFIIINFITPFLIPRVIPKLGYSFFMDGGILYPALVIHFAFYAVSGIYLLSKAYLTSSGNTRNQLKYLSWGTILGYVFGVTNFLPVYNITVFPYPFGSYGIAIYVGIAAYAIIKYRLLDINIAAVSVAIFTVVYALVLGVPFGLAGWFRNELTAVFGQNWFWLPMVVLLGSATFGPFIFMFLQKKAKNEILKDEMRNHAMLLADVQHIPLVHDIEKLCDSILTMATEILNATFASIYLAGREKKAYFFYVTKNGRRRDIKIETGNLMVKYLINVKEPAMLEELKREYDRKHDVFMKEVLNTMNKLNADVVVPFLIEEDLVGFLVLGFKKSDEIYSTDDLYALANLASQAALAIENAQFLKEREEMQAKLRKTSTLAAMGELLSVVNHEFRNKLNLINSPAQGLMMGMYKNKPDAEKKAVDTIAENMGYMQDMLRYLQEYREKSKDNTATFYNLSDCMQRAFDHSKDKIVEWKITTNQSFVPSVMMKGLGTFPDIFKHLVVNAIWSMEGKGGTLKIKGTEIEDKKMIEIIQEDEGKDISDELKDKQLDGGGYFVDRGKLGGLNLILAQKIVSDHKGAFEIQSNNGHGTRFVIRLPLDFTKA